MSNTLSNYALNVDRNAAAATASKAYLKKVGVIVAPNSVNQNPAASIRVTSYGTSKKLSDGSDLIFDVGVGPVADLGVNILGEVSGLEENPENGSVFTVDDSGDLIINAEQDVQAVNAGDLIAWNSADQAWEYFGLSTYTDESALRWIDPDPGISFLMSQLGYIYLIFSRDAQVIGEMCESKFFTLTYSDSVTPTEVADLVSYWAGGFWFNAADNSTVGGFLTADSDSMYRVANADGTTNKATLFSAICEFIGSSNWNNCQYSEFKPNSGVDTLREIESLSMASVPAANSHFDNFDSFYIWNEEAEISYLGFLCTTTGLSATSPYVRKEVEIDIQNDFVSYISINKSMNIATVRKNMNSRFNKIVNDYIESGLLDDESENTISVTESESRFYISGRLNLVNAAALWRASLEGYYTEAQEPTGSIGGGGDGTDEGGQSGGGDDGGSNPVIELPTPVVLTSFDDITLWTGDSGAEASRAIDGDGFLKTSRVLTKSDAFPLESSMGAIAYLSRLETNAESICLGSTMEMIQGGDIHLLSGEIDYNIDVDSYGDRWEVSHVSDAVADGLSTGQDVDLRFTSYLRPPQSSYHGFKKILARANGIPTVVLTFDDGRLGPYNYLSYLRERDIKGTIFVPWENVINGDVNTIDLYTLRRLRGAGFDIQLDGTGNDGLMTDRGSVANAVSHLGEGRQWLADNGLNENARHFCYPNGVTGLSMDDVTVLSGITGDTNEGSAVVTISDTSGLSAGLIAECRRFPKRTRILSVDSSTQLTLDNAALSVGRGGEPITGASNIPIAFFDDSLEFYPNTLQQALSADGWKIGRTTRPGQMYSRFGLADEALFCKSQNQGSSPLSYFTTKVNEAKKYGTTCVFYLHDIAGNDDSSINITEQSFYEVIDFLVSEREAGNIQILTVDEWYQRDIENPQTPESY